MKVSSLFGETRREAPADEHILSQQLLVRAGYIDKLSAGIFSYLPLAWRSIRKIEQILREEMDAIGGQELSMPVVHPAEPWQRTGRWYDIDDSMVRFKDRKGHDMALAMTHEEIVGELAASHIRSVKNLPQLIYQIQTKFRDEARPRGGLIRVREFIMKDSYSLDTDEEGLRTQYARHYTAYMRIGARVGLPLVAVGSDVGMMGGKLAHEFIYLTPIGEDTIILSESGDYAANREAAVFAKPKFDGGTSLPLSEIETPGTETIADLADFLKISPMQTAKALFQVATFAGETPSKVVVALIRGDLEVNLTMLRNRLGALEIRPAVADEIASIGAVAGYGSAIGIQREGTLVIVDDSVAETSNLVAGANKAGYHLLNTNYGRDFAADIVGNIADAQEGFESLLGGRLVEKRGVEVGNIFQLGTKYTEANKVYVTLESGESVPVVMGSYGIGVGRVLACAAEEYHDEQGLKLPISIAPYHVALVSLCRDEANVKKAEAFYLELMGAGVEVLFDDRPTTAGVKFADADLRGLPIQVIISDRSLSTDSVEVKLRSNGSRTVVPYAEVVDFLKKTIQGMFAELSESAHTVGQQKTS